MSKELFVREYILDLLKAVKIKRDTDLLYEVSTATETAEDKVADVLSDLIRTAEISSFYWFNNEDSGTLFMPKGSRII